MKGNMIWGGFFFLFFLAALVVVCLVPIPDLTPKRTALAIVVAAIGMLISWDVFYQAWKNN